MALKLNIISATERPYADSLYRALHSGAAAHGVPVDRAGAR
jgi:hypothetical protein